MKLKTIIIFCLYFSIIRTAYPQKNEFAHGQIMQEKSDKDTTISYQVYLPNSLTNNPPPILFIFDPSGNSKRAIELFINTAEKCQTILICSDQNKNGPFDKNLSIFESMYEDVQSKFEFNSQIQILTGFSGGSRLSTYLAVRKQKFCGVIACGAGLPFDVRYQPSVISDFGYYGIVGRKDMNFTEMLEVEKYTEEINLDHYFSYTEDAHKWPSSGELTKALTWQLARSEQKKKNSSTSFSAEFLNSEQAFLDTIYTQEKILEYHNKTSEIKNIFPDASTYLIFHKIDSTILIEQIKAQEKTIEKEQSQIGIYFDNFGLALIQHPNTKPISWWKSEYDKWTKVELDSFEKTKYPAIRIKNFISAYAHQSLWKSLEAKDFEKAEWLTQLIFEISEQKAYGYFLQAKLAALKTEYKVAEKKLELAIENGLSKKSYLMDESAFQAMRERKRFKKLLDSLE